MIFKNKGFQLTKKETPTSPMTSLRNKVNFDIQLTNPHADIVATGRCKYWTTDVDEKNDIKFPQMTLYSQKCTLPQ
jgi:hypothetical protein